MNQPVKIQSPNMLSQRISKRYYETLGTSVINRPLSPLSLKITCPQIGQHENQCKQNMNHVKKTRITTSISSEVKNNMDEKKTDIKI